MGLCLCPNDGEVTSPDLSMPCTGFGRFRERWAQAEGIVLSEMCGFGGERQWSDVATTLEPFLNHSDCDGELSPAECAALLPRMEEIFLQWRNEADDPLLRQHIEYGRQLLVVLRFCVEKDVELLFA
ncbi:hypothetical protein ABGB12_28985 [Actinocorallia sp. B10E7]|uniref:hypothetical protein n=1 Tax=Actinocorallia sp. B10E7 TaxID=3153558 RepID=UPI00325DFED5